MGVLVLASGYYLANRINGKPVTETIGGKDYLVTETVRDAYVGYLQKQLKCFYVVSDSEYERLKGRGTMLYIHNYRLADDRDFEAARAAVDTLVSNTDENFTARGAFDPFDNELDWVKALHALGRTMYTSLFSIYVVSTAAVFFVFVFCCIFSVAVYRKNVLWQCKAFHNFIISHTEWQTFIYFCFSVVVI